MAAKKMHFKALLLLFLTLSNRKVYLYNISSLPPVFFYQFPYTDEHYFKNIEVLWFIIHTGVFFMLIC